MEAPWIREWLNLLEYSVGRDRFKRYEKYARDSMALEIHKGRIQGKFNDPREKNWIVTAFCPALSSPVWGQALKKMAQKAQYGASLFSGAMPGDMDGLFRECGSEFFPKSIADFEFESSCECREEEICKHKASLWMAAAGHFSADPFLFFKLRGRGREEMLQGLLPKQTALPEKTGLARDADLSKGAFWRFTLLPEADFEKGLSFEPEAFAKAFPPPPPGLEGLLPAILQLIEKTALEAKRRLEDQAGAEETVPLL